MEHSVSVQSVGVLGVCSPIPTFIIRLTINSTKFESDQYKAQLSNTLDLSYKTYNSKFSTGLMFEQVLQLFNTTFKPKIENMVDEYLETVQLVDEYGYVVRKNILKSNISIPGLENISLLKEQILKKLSFEYTKYIKNNFI